MSKFPVNNLVMDCGNWGSYSFEIKPHLLPRPSIKFHPLPKSMLPLDRIGKFIMIQGFKEDDDKWRIRG